MRVFLQALGCRLNEAELETWSRDCRARGFALTDRAEHADLVVINSCAVTGESVRKSRQLVRRAQRANPNAKLVLSDDLIADMLRARKAAVPDETHFDEIITEAAANGPQEKD